MTDARPAWLMTPAGHVPYDRANDAMHELAGRRLAGEIPDTVILLEHPPVFTAGRRAKDDELLWDESSIEAMGGLVRKIDRGGSFTFHGPGQLVGYPILGLGAAPDAAGYLRHLEHAVVGPVAPSGRSSSRVTTCRPGCGRATTRYARSASGYSAPGSPSTGSP